MMLLTSSFFLVEIIVGYITNSMALVADSFHMLSDVASLIVGFLALRYSAMGKRTHKYTFGYVRAEVLGALVNAVFLVALCFSIFVESMKRMVIPEEVDNAELVLIVGSVGLVVNVIGLFLFHQHGHGHSHGGGHGHSHGGGHRHSHDAGQNCHSTGDKNGADHEGAKLMDQEFQGVQIVAEKEKERLALMGSNGDVVKTTVDVTCPLVLDDDVIGEYKTEITAEGKILHLSFII